MLNVIFLCGEICSGKNYYYKNLMEVQGWDRIIVSDIVKELIQSKKREDLQSTANRDLQIADVIVVKMKTFNGKGKLVIDGIRQTSILERIEKSIDADYGYIWLDVDFEKRRERYKARSADKDKESSFEVAERRDIDLGIRKLQAFLRIKRTEKLLIEKR